MNPTSSTRIHPPTPRKTKKSHFWLWFFFWLLFIGINAVGLYIGNIIYEEASLRTAEIKKQTPQDIQERFDRGLHQRNWQTVSLTSQYGYTMKGTFIPHPEGSDKTIIFLHGFQENRQMGLNFIRLIQKNGYNVLLYDARAHGESGGDSITWGTKEKYDVQQWVDYIHQTYPNGTIGIYGVSLGAATALLHSEINNEKKLVSFYIADSPYSDLSDLLVKQVEKNIPKEGRILTKIIVPYADIMAYYHERFLYHQSSPIRAVKDLTIPVLYLHGQGDTLIPSTMSTELYEATQSSQKEIKLFPNSAHAQERFDYPDVYSNAVSEFIKKAEK